MQVLDRSALNHEPIPMDDSRPDYLWGYGIGSARAYELGYELTNVVINTEARVLVVMYSLLVQTNTCTVWIKRKD